MIGRPDLTVTGISRDCTGRVILEGERSAL